MRPLRYRYSPLITPQALYARRVGCLPQLDWTDAAGFWDLEVRTPPDANRGHALVASAARRVDLAASQLYDVEITPRVSSVSPTLISPVGGATLTIQGSGFGAYIGDLRVEAAGVPCTPTSVTAHTLECRMSPIDLSSHAADAPFVGDRGVSWQWW